MQDGKLALATFENDIAAFAVRILPNASAVFIAGKTLAMMTSIRIPAPRGWQITCHTHSHIRATLAGRW